MNIGERIGDYEIVQILGAGGMGQVYKVRNVLSDRIEAMKVLLPNLEGDPGLADRFLNEIKVQATLDHPNIAKLHTAMRTGNQLVMVMEFVDGTSLAQVLRRGPLPPSTGGTIRPRGPPSRTMGRSASRHHQNPPGPVGTWRVSGRRVEPRKARSAHAPEFDQKSREA